jgi:hypothetical protein
MPARPVHECECDDCKSGRDVAIWQSHHNINLLVSRLDEQQRRWYLAVESLRIGYGGDRFMALVTGMDEETVARGRREVAADLGNRPADRVRVPGGGRPPAQKKTKR